MNINTNIGVKGHFTARIGKEGDPSSIREIDLGHNLITSYGLKKVILNYNNDYYFSNMKLAVGRGTLTPTLSTNMLDNIIPNTLSNNAKELNNSTFEIIGDYIVVSNKASFLFPTGTFNNNDKISELGLIIEDTSNINLINYISIKDNNNNNPSYFTVNNDEFLEITYVIKFYFDHRTNNSTIKILDKSGVLIKEIGATKKNMRTKLTNNNTSIHNSLVRYTLDAFKLRTGNTVNSIINEYNKTNLMGNINPFLTKVFDISINYATDSDIVYTDNNTKITLKYKLVNSDVFNFDVVSYTIMRGILITFLLAEPINKLASQSIEFNVSFNVVNI